MQVSSCKYMYIFKMSTSKIYWLNICTSLKCLAAKYTGANLGKKCIRSKKNWRIKIKVDSGLLFRKIKKQIQTNPFLFKTWPFLISRRCIYVLEKTLTHKLSLIKLTVIPSVFYMFHNWRNNTRTAPFRGMSWPYFTDFERVIHSIAWQKLWPEADWMNFYPFLSNQGRLA